MSTDSGFARVTFPRIRDAGRERWEAQGQAHGHAAGYAAGLRAAAAEVAERSALLAAEHEAALRRGQATVDAAVAALAAAARALDERTMPVVADSEDVLVASAVELAEAILGRELSTDADSARHAVDRVLGDVDASSVHAVRLNPGDLAALDPAVRERTGVRFVADASLARGDAIADLPDGFLDARIGAALDRARVALLGGAL